MKRFKNLVIILLFCSCLLSCKKPEKQVDIAATTLPVYDITAQLCRNTGLTVSRLITENVSCLHDYTLNPDQMKRAESADLLVISGAGFEDFMEDVIASANTVADASAGIHLHCSEHDHDDTHNHDQDPHIWLSPENGKLMAENICTALCKTFPEHESEFKDNLFLLQTEFDRLIELADLELSNLSCRKIITFHDSFSYMAESFNLTILHAIEEESGSEASAADIIEICNLIKEHQIPSIFTEKHGSNRAATIVSGETGAKVYTLDTGLSGNNYLEAIQHNIYTLKEALE